MAEQSINITFVTSEVAVGEALVVELDAEKNENKTQFLYGEKAYFRVYTYPESMPITITESDGNITLEGSGTSEEEEQIIFPKTKEGLCSKPVKSITSSKWFGNSLGSVSAEGTKISVPSEGVAVLKLKYKADFKRYALSLTSKDEESYTVIVYVEGGETD